MSVVDLAEHGADRTIVDCQRCPEPLRRDRAHVGNCDGTIQYFHPTCCPLCPVIPRGWAGPFDLGPNAA